MALNVWEVFLAMFGRGEETEKDPGDEGDEGRFVPSPLDLSVRIGHGGSDDERVRELARIRDRAEEIEEEQRGN